MMSSAVLERMSPTSQSTPLNVALFRAFQICQSSTRSPSFQSGGEVGAPGGEERIPPTESKGPSPRRRQVEAARAHEVKICTAVSSAEQEAHILEGAQFFANRFTRVLRRSRASKQAKILIFLGSLEHQMSMEV